MKKILILSLTSFALTAQAQKTLPKKTVPQKSTSNVLKNLTDSASYAIGISVANFYVQQGIKNLNTALIVKAMNDVYAKKPSLLSETQLNETIMKCMENAQSQKSKPVIEASEKFLSQNKTRSSVKTTASGLQYEVLKEGQGPRPAATDTVVVNYAGTLIDGTEFDNSYKRGAPIEFPLNRVISGWTEALQLMNVGSKYKLYIPHNLGYGLHGSGAIPGGAALIFEVELLGIKK